MGRRLLDVAAEPVFMTEAEAVTVNGSEEKFLVSDWTRGCFLRLLFFGIVVLGGVQRWIA